MNLPCCRANEAPSALSHQIRQSHQSSTSIILVDSGMRRSVVHGNNPYGIHTGKVLIVSGADFKVEDCVKSRASKVLHETDVKGPTSPSGAK